VEIIKTHILCPTTFYFRRSCLLDNVEKYNRAGQVADYSTIRRMRIACWSLKATDTHLEYVILIIFPLQKWLRELGRILKVT
jgi:hypothetical protein